MSGDIVTATDARIYIGPVVLPAVDTASEFAALTYTEIDMVEDLGEFGDEQNIVTGTTLKDGRVRKAKGAADTGTLALRCFHDPLDTGQAALIAASKTKKNYAFKIVLPDAPDSSYSSTTIYFRALVASRRLNVGQNDNLIRRAYSLAINSDLAEALAALITP
ncbi:phage tail tube protein [Methylopila sp. M107]|uniref:phage tail tube protein n=1 Tax=Methylopila sp. M107 TaxID=1101190 RepID=UPI000375C941|nr:phage tail tube protein [Methylopila sp. M107]